MPGTKGNSGGHNRKTNREKELLGTAKRRINEETPDIIRGDLMEYRGLGKIGIAIRDSFGPMLINNGTLSITDSLAFHQFCVAAERWLEALDSCVGKPQQMPIYDSDGKVIGAKLSPFHEAELRYREALYVAERELGLSPRSRDTITKISTGKKPGIKKVT